MRQDDLLTRVKKDEEVNKQVGDECHGKVTHFKDINLLSKSTVNNELRTPYDSITI